MPFYLDMLRKELNQEQDDVYENHVFNEVYFGKNDNLLKLEDIIGNIRDKYKKKQNEVNSAKEWNTFASTMEKAFELESFSIEVLDTPAYNASTVPMSFVIDAPNMKIKANEHGFNLGYMKGSTIISFITRGLLFSPLFTNEEIIAVLLHEIGHNFQSTISPLSCGYGYIQRMLLLFKLPLEAIIIAGNDPSDFFRMNQKGRRWYTDVLKKFRSDGDQTMNDIRSTSMILKIISTVAWPIVLTIEIAALFMLLKPAGVLIFSQFLNLLGFNGEVVADNFSTAYGYGAALTNAMTKIYKESNKWSREKAIKDNPFMVAWINFWIIPITLLMSICDPHPDMAYRCQDQIHMLEKELDKPEHSPKVKTQIKKQIKNIEKNLDEITTQADDEAFNFTKHYSAFLKTVFGGDIKWFAGAFSQEEFDRAYDKNLAKLDGGNSIFNNLKSKINFGITRLS